MECPGCGHEFDEENEHQDADHSEEFEVVCEACEQEFWVQAQVTYVYRVVKREG
jgi:uncharacterized protein with PIN domain